MWVTAILTLLLVFYSGYAIRGQSSTTVSEMVASSFLYSMLISWLIFLLAFFLDLSLVSLSILIVAVTGLGFYFGSYKKPEVTGGYSKKDLLLCLCILLLAGVLLFLIYLYTQKFYQPVFTFWDAVVSYNHWAIDLADGEYHVGGAAYPVLYPGLWSLVYRLQDDPGFWIISKATLLAAPITLFIYSVTLSLERRSLFPIFFVIGSFAVVIIRTPYFLSGMMDTAVVILGMLSCLILWKESTEEKAQTLSLLAGAIASLIKQAGLAFLLLAMLMKLTENWRIRASIAQYWKQVLLALAIPLSFLAFFLYHNDFQQIAASFRGLQKVAENAANGNELIPHALELAYNYLPIKIILPLGLLVVVGIYLSTPRLRWLSIFSLIIATVGFLIWMLFTAYDIRNLYWSIILIIFAAAIGLDTLINKTTGFFFNSTRSTKAGSEIQIPGISWLKPILIALPLLSLLPIMTKGENWLLALNNSSRNEVIPPALRPMFNRPPPGLPANFAVLTNIQPLSWAPKLNNRIEFVIFLGNYTHLKNRLKKSKAIVLLLKKLPNGGGYPNIQKLKDEQLIKQVVDSKLYSIYMIQR